MSATTKRGGARVSKAQSPSEDRSLTRDEIERLFVSEWVLVESPSSDVDLQVRKGIVGWHSADHDEVYRKAIELKPKRVLLLDTHPQDSAIVL